MSLQHRHSGPTFSPVEKEVLAELLINGDDLAGNIADRTGRHPSSVSRSMSNLDDEAMVRNKGRGVRTLTAAGVQAAREAERDTTVADEETEVCIACEGEYTVHQVVEHHTSYDPEVTVTVCESCHAKIHNTDGFRDDLEPDMSRAQAVADGLLAGGRHV